MRVTHRLLPVLLVGCATVGASLVGAGGPFRVLRSTSCVSLHSSPPVAVVGTSPFDDASGLLYDGALYFYAAVDASGAPVQISVHKHPVRQTIRVSFDDAKPQSAPVHRQLSTVVAAPDTVLADGTATIEITIVPRDADGIPLGAGLDLDLDSNALWPGYMSGLIVDQGDGSYAARVVSTIPGTGHVQVTVEGVALASEPLLTYEDVGSATLRELALMRFENLTASGGLFDQLIEGLNPNTDPGANKLDQAHSQMLDALNRLYAFQDVSALDNYLKGALGNLAAALASPGQVDPQGIETLINLLLDSARLLALYHVEEAESSCGACGAGGSSKICDARQELAKGDAERQKSNPKYEDVAAYYAKAVDNALQACP